MRVENKMNENNLSTWIEEKKSILNIILALLAIGVVLFENFCSGSCSYLSGDLFGFDLRYFGISFMVLVILLTLTKKFFPLILALSVSLGIEIYLAGFQIWFKTYCPYCLAFGGFLVILFFLNINQTTIKRIILSVAIGLILFTLFFKGSVTPAFAAETLLPSFGTGKINVRLYTDYFCGPCRSMEPTIEPILTDLVKRNSINLIFIDTPLSKTTPLYARYFLYAMNEKKTLQQAFFARTALIGASLEKITEPTKLEEFLKNKGVEFKIFEVKPTFEILNSYISADKVRSTPTCVIVQDGKTNQFTGKTNIINALEKIRQ